jgi:hypothetical protein
MAEQKNQITIRHKQRTTEENLRILKTILHQTTQIAPNKKRK